MRLQDQLDHFKADFTRKVPAPTLAIMNRATADLRASGILDHVIKVGENLPPFALPNQDGAIVQSADLLARGPLVISFFRGVWCPYCNIELKALQDAAASFRAAGAELVVIAPQLEDSAKQTHEDHGLTFDVLVDEGNRYAQRLGIVFTLPEDLRQVYRGFGVGLPQFNGDESWSLPMPTRLVVDQDGFVRDADIDPDYTIRPDPAETLAALRTLRAAA